MRGKIPQLREAFTGNFDDDHRFLLTKMLARVDGIDTDIAAPDAQIGTHLAPFAPVALRVDEVPGIGPVAAAVIIAEIGVDMTRFPTPGHICSWAKVRTGREDLGRQEQRQRVHGARQPRPGRTCRPS
jgi:transposase